MKEVLFIWFDSKITKKRNEALKRFVFVWYAYLESMSVKKKV